MHRVLVTQNPELIRFSQWLGRRGVSHRVSEERGQQVLWVEDPRLVGPVSTQFARFEEQPTAAFWSSSEAVAPSATARRSVGWVGRTPWTLGLVLATTLVTLIVWLSGGELLLPDFTFYQYARVGGHLFLEDFSLRQPWRLITPIFLHFGVLHLVFNMLWLWDLGRRIEVRQGVRALVGLVVLLGLGSNCAQALVTQEAVFGGMSGVVFGLFGYLWVWGRLAPEPLFVLPRGILVLLLAWLALGFSGLLTAFGFGAIANTAHASGLAAGCLAGTVGVWLQRWHRGSGSLHEPK
ncbi:MAG: rhomboid family intramembrane serine protease [Pseudomonadota bacterium]|nr:rhomboid family intramembrane serine protease [Pseudomonadota bacterium]